MKSDAYNILFSIIMPTFNRAHMISTAIESVLRQTYSNWELIIVNDGSTDNTEELIKVYSKNESRIHYFSQENKGRSAARNKGIELSKGDYISFLDDDDYYFENFIEEFEKKLKNLLFPICVILCRQIENENGLYKKYDKDRHKYSSNLIKMYLKYPNVQSLCTSSKILKNIKFDERFSIGEDFHLFLRVLMQYPTFFINEYLCVNVFHDRGTMYNEIVKMNFIKSKYNSLDMINDLFLNHYDLIKKNKIHSILIKKFNQKAYFYASACLKRYNFIASLNFLSRLKHGFNLQPIYYFFSILFRLPFFSLKSLLKKSKEISNNQ